MQLLRRVRIALALLIVASLAISACQPQIVEVEKVVIQEKEVPVEVEDVPVVEVDPVEVNNDVPPPAVDPGEVDNVPAVDNGVPVNPKVNPADPEGDQNPGDQNPGLRLHPVQRIQGDQN